MAVHQSPLIVYPVTNTGPGTAPIGDGGLSAPAPAAPGANVVPRSDLIRTWDQLTAESNARNATFMDQTTDPIAPTPPNPSDNPTLPKPSDNPTLSNASIIDDPALKYDSRGKLRGRCINSLGQLAIQMCTCDSFEHAAGGDKDICRYCECRSTAHEDHSLTSAQLSELSLTTLLGLGGNLGNLTQNMNMAMMQSPHVSPIGKQFRPSSSPIRTPTVNRL